MPRKVRQIIADLKKAGFVDRGGKGSHRNFVDGKGNRVTVSGKEGSDAPPYLERQVKEKIETSQKDDETDKSAQVSRSRKAPGGRLS